LNDITALLTMSTPIPRPPGLPILGNIAQVDKELPTVSLHNLHLQYGEIFQISMLGKTRTFAASQRIVHELCDQNRFKKIVSGALFAVRALAGDGGFW
jgi:cytochrome P450/NADPH-cytochrome P450 reductase